MHCWLHGACAGHVGVLVMHEYAPFVSVHTQCPLCSAPVAARQLGLMRTQHVEPCMVRVAYMHVLLSAIRTNILQFCHRCHAGIRYAQIHPGLRPAASLSDLDSSTVQAAAEESGDMSTELQAASPPLAAPADMSGEHWQLDTMSTHVLLAADQVWAPRLVVLNVSYVRVP